MTPLERALKRKIRHHARLEAKHAGDEQKRDYHRRWREACEKELAELRPNHH